MSDEIESLFDQRLLMPDFEARERWSRIVGLDDAKARLTKMLGMLVNPGGLTNWAKKFHPQADFVVGKLLRRPPLVVLAGDVGCGKTEMAETVGDAVAREQKIEISLFPLSLSARGQGRVGEMTNLLAKAFAVTADEAQKFKSSSGKSRGAVLLLVDEADAIAQSRENAQMHHEDRAGVNAFIRGVDQITRQAVPAAVIMCTNRLSALDPAIKRRAADILTFKRPDETQRAAVLSELTSSFDFSISDVAMLARATGTTAERAYGYTYSDLLQRLIPAIILDAYPEKSVSATRAIALAEAMSPTPPFEDKHP